MTATFHVDDPNAPEPNQPRALGACIVLLNDDATQVMLEHRTDSDLWGLVGGTTDDDESILTCLHREVLEETSLTLAECHFLGVWSNPTRILAYSDGNVRSSIGTCFIGRLGSGTPVVSDESHAFGWFAWDAIPWEQVPPTQQGMLRQGAVWVKGERAPYVD